MYYPKVIKFVYQFIYYILIIVLELSIVAWCSAALYAQLRKRSECTLYVLAGVAITLGWVMSSDHTGF